MRRELIFTWLLVIAIVEFQSVQLVTSESQKTLPSAVLLGANIVVNNIVTH